MEHREAGADLVGEGEEVEFGTEPAMIQRLADRMRERRIVPDDGLLTVPGSALARIWQAEGYRVMVAVPLLRPDGPLGVAAASYRHDRAFTSEQLATMQRAAALWTTEALTADLLPRVVQFAREQEVRARMSEAIEAHLTETRTVAPPAEFAARLIKEREKWANYIKRLGVTVDE